MAVKSFKFYSDIIVTFLPIIILIVASFWLASHFIAPAAPKKITITTGHMNGAYYQIAKKYRDELIKDGITLEIIESSGSHENISRLLKNEAQVAFVQGGAINQNDNNESLVSLGSLYYEPVWIFLNSKLHVNQLKDFAKLRIATGPEGSGTQSMVNTLLKMNEIDSASASFLSLSNEEATKGILEHDIDIAFFVASAEAPVIQKLLRDNRVHLLSLNRAKAYSYLLPYLSEITLAEGVIDLHKNIPSKNITMIAPTANLVVDKNLHSTLQVLLLKATKKIHSSPGLFSAANEFPSAHKTVLPISEMADRYFKVGPPFLMRYLPFNVAIFIDRMIVLLIPLLALMLPLIKIMPSIYRWKIRSSIYRWYEKLQEIEHTSAFTQELTEEHYNKLIEELVEVEQQVNKIKTPLSYTDQLFNLLLHIDLVKKKLRSNLNS